MSIKSIRIIFGVLYGAAFLFFLSSCSPNVASVDKASLRALHQTSSTPSSSNGGTEGTIADSQKQPLLQAKVLSKDELESIQDQDESSNNRYILVKDDHDDAVAPIHELSQNNSIDFRIKEQILGSPAEVFFAARNSATLSQLAALEKCPVHLEQIKAGNWRLSLADPTQCQVREDALKNFDEIVVLFRAKGSFQVTE